MAEFNFDDLKKTITDAADVVTKKTEAFVSIQKLKGQIYTLERSIDKKYQELGAVVFEQYSKGDKINDESAVVCEEISRVNANIAELREDLASKHGCKVCPVCEAEVPVEAMFCMKCGTQMPEEKCDCGCSSTKEECSCGCEEEKGGTDMDFGKIKDEIEEGIDKVKNEAKEGCEKAEKAFDEAKDKVEEEVSKVTGGDDKK